MLGLAEYSAAAGSLLGIARAAEADITAGRVDARSSYQWYYQKYHQVLADTMLQVAHNAVDHYSKLLNLERDPDLVNLLVFKQYDDQYYGLTLNQRLALNFAALSRKTKQSALVGAADRVLTSRVPFGAHYLVDKRVLLGTIAKIEQDAAKATATKAGIKLIKWTLSSRHPRKDECDFLADRIEPKVAQYIKDNKLNLNPKGLYFVEDLPHPPHPNCQCEYQMVRDEGTVRLGPLQRTLHTITGLLRKILSR